MSRFIFVFALFASLTAPALAQSASTKDVYACKAIATASERLACYDAAVGRLEAAEKSGDVTTVSRADVEKVKRESFGFKIPSLPSIVSRNGGDEVARIESINEPVRSASAPAGKARVMLENGQVWVQIDDKKVRIKDPQLAEISQAAMGSYKMKLDGGLAFRVRREQ